MLQVRRTGRLGRRRCKFCRFLARSRRLALALSLSLSLGYVSPSSPSLPFLSPFSLHSPSSSLSSSVCAALSFLLALLLPPRSPPPILLHFRQLLSRPAGLVLFFSLFFSRPRPAVLRLFFVLFSHILLPDLLLFFPCCRFGPDRQTWTAAA